MKLRMLVVLLAIASAGMGSLTAESSAAPTGNARIETSLNVSPHFYSQEVHFDVHYRIYAPPGACLKDQYGGYVQNDYACTEFEQNDASWDIRVWQTTPSWRSVYGERELGIEGQGSADVFLASDLGLPYGCYGQHWRRNFKVVVRIFSPLTSRALATKSFSFYVHC